MELETVKIAAEVTDENPLGYIVINKTDLTEDHVLFDEQAKKPKGKKTAVAADAQAGSESATQDGNEGA